MSNRIDEQVKDILLLHDGIRRADIARILGADRSRISRAIDRLSAYYPLVEDEERKLSIDKSRILSTVDLDIHEIVALFLACRMLARGLNVYNIHTASVLKKIALCLEKASPDISRQIDKSSDEIRGLFDRLGSRKYIRILEALSLCWLHGRKAMILHYSNREKREKQYRAAVYSIEPYSQGRSLHVLAKCDGEDFIRDFKIERITKVSELMEKYEVPAGFSNSGHFRDAWGIWLNAGTGPEKTVLRFSPAVAGRVKENNWHPSQELKDNGDGSLTAAFLISQPLEMLPWIRGWGRDVEVIAPPELRRKLKEELKEQLGLYEG
ncbi:MAG: WYL domain-containing protein [Spirochaetales bacterium]|nr:WYL domain-containing protein [Spirochaetales bacterium]